MNILLNVICMEVRAPMAHEEVERCFCIVYCKLYYIKYRRNNTYFQTLNANFISVFGEAVSKSFAIEKCIAMSCVFDLGTTKKQGSDFDGKNYFLKERLGEEIERDGYPV